MRVQVLVPYTEREPAPEIPRARNLLQVLLKSNVEGVGKANEVVQVNKGAAPTCPTHHAFARAVSMLSGPRLVAVVVFRGLEHVPEI